MSETYYKVLDETGGAIYGKGAWHLPPSKNRKGKWMPKVEEIKLCKSGYHATDREHLLDWLGPRIFEVEFKGEIIRGNNKIVGHQARLVREFRTWTEQTQRLFACDCAERVLGIANDKRCDNAVLVSRQFAFGLVDRSTRDAARAAARAATWAATRAAAWDAARAAWDAARAASDAAWAARAAGAGGEAVWQTNRLFEYLNGEVDLVAMEEGLRVEL